MTAPDLAPCPFCGGEAETTLGPVPGKWGARCKNCDVWRDDREPTKAEAIAAWNTRATPTSTDPKVKALVEAAQFLIDRLNEYENEAWMREEESREWCGKVQPAKARLTALLTEKPHDRV